MRNLELNLSPLSGMLWSSPVLFPSQIVSTHFNSWWCPCSHSVLAQARSLLQQTRISRHVTSYPTYHFNKNRSKAGSFNTFPHSWQTVLIIVTEKQRLSCVYNHLHRRICWATTSFLISSPEYRVKLNKHKYLTFNSKVKCLVRREHV